MSRRAKCDTGKTAKPASEILLNEGSNSSGLWALGHLTDDEFLIAVASSQYRRWPLGDPCHCWVNARDIANGVPCDDATNLTKERVGQNAIAVTVCEEAWGFVLGRS